VALKEKEMSNWGGILDAALEIGRRRQDILQLMRSALERGDNAEALRLGRSFAA
jgi:hypothetical protein